MDDFLNIAKALSDETRVRALLSLKNGELCLCQIIDLLQLAPSTISKHMDLLRQAGLVQRRKQGRWQYFSLAGKDAAPEVRKALAWALDALKDNERIAADDKKLGCVLKKDLEKVCACYREN